jgi:hypothetical protein
LWRDAERRRRRGGDKPAASRDDNPIVGQLEGERLKQLHLRRGERLGKTGGERIELGCVVKPG